jgi:hypothetical protein
MLRLIYLCCLLASACSTTPPPVAVNCPKMEIPQELMQPPSTFRTDRVFACPKPVTKNNSFPGLGLGCQIVRNYYKLLTNGVTP